MGSLSRKWMLSFGIAIAMTGAAWPQVDEAASAQKVEPLQRTWSRGPLEINLWFENSAPLVADVVGARLHVTAPFDAEVKLPSLSGLPADFQVSEIRPSGPDLGEDGRRVWQLGFRLEVFRAAQFEFPAVTVQYRVDPSGDWQAVETEPVVIEFHSMLGDDPALAKLRPNPAPVDWPFDWLPWILMASAVVATMFLVLGGWLVAARMLRRDRLPTPISPYQRALEAIASIAAARYLERGELDRFYTELSGVIRHYIEDQFGIHAPEQTTDEFLQELSRRPLWGDDERSALENFLEQCDLVKFAQVRPSAAEGEAALRAARAFVETTGGSGDINSKQSTVSQSISSHG